MWKPTIAYCNLGNVYDRLGDFQKTIEYQERHVKISKEVGDTYRLISPHEVLYINKYIFCTFVLVDALFWRLTNTWITNNISIQNNEHEVGWWKISIPENLELEIWTGILQPGVTSCVLRLDLPTNQWVFISKHSSHLCETWQAGSFPPLQPFDELFYCKSQSRGSRLPCNGQSLSLKMGNN